jgi:molybdopterin converting factor small subunit
MAHRSDPSAAAAEVTVAVPGMLREYCRGAREVRVAAATVRAALEQLARDWPDLHRNVRDETGAVRRHVNLFVNASHIRDLEGLDSPLAPGDVVTILPAVSGG